jgi:hypothetical protein
LNNLIGIGCPAHVIQNAVQTAYLLIFIW